MFLDYRDILYAHAATTPFKPPGRYLPQCHSLHYCRQLSHPPLWDIRKGRMVFTDIWKAPAHLCVHLWGHAVFTAYTFTLCSSDRARDTLQHILPTLLCCLCLHRPSDCLHYSPESATLSTHLSINLLLAFSCFHALQATMDHLTQLHKCNTKRDKESLNLPRLTC